jgi:DNA-binding transcriptional MerR regulator
MPDDPYTLGDLARLADVTPRTVRYYVAQGLLPSPESAGPATRYGEGHLARLRLIKRLQRDHLPLAEIRAKLERMGDEEVLAAAATLDPQEPEPSLDRAETLGFIRTLMHHAGVRPTVPEIPNGTPAARFTSMPAPASESASASAPAPAPSVLRLAERPSLQMRRDLVAPDAAATPSPDRAPSPDLAPSPFPHEAPSPHEAPPAPTVPAPTLPALTPLALTPPALTPRAAVAPTPAPAAPAARTGPDRTTWERLVISADVELHIRRPLDRHTNKRVDQLERIARELFEDP